MKVTCLPIIGSQQSVREGANADKDCAYLHVRWRWWESDERPSPVPAMHGDMLALGVTACIELARMSAGRM